MDDERSDLLEQAYQLRRQGRPDRAIALLADWPSWPEAEDRAFAQADVADSLFALGRHDEAVAVLQALLRTRPPASVCDVAADLCAENGLPSDALRFYDVGVAGLTAEDLGSMGWEATYLLRQRARARAEQGLEPDVLDLSVPPLEQHRRRPTLEDVEAGADVRGEVVRALYWPRSLLTAAQERWPGIGDHAGLQERLLAAAAVTGRHVELVAGGPDLLDGDLDAVERHLHETDDVVAWPPQRNAACWCGSGRKYKRCCLRPGSSG